MCSHPIYAVCISNGINLLELMVVVRSINELDRTNLKVKETYRILSSRKSYLVKVEDELCLTNDYVQTLIRKFADVSPDLVEVYQLN